MTDKSDDREFARRLLIGVSTLAISLSGGLTAAKAAEAASVEQPVDEIVVTGSRVVRDGYQAPTPVTVMNADEILRSAPTNTADFINKLPVFSASNTARNSSNNMGGTYSGVSTLNLRGLGATRALVLLDGVRIVGASVDSSSENGGAVDTSAFPEGLISRVDVVTGGASAAYGSDALSGVVNFVLDRNFTGVKGTVTGGLTTYGDDMQYTLTLTAGTPLASGRGHLLFNAVQNFNAGIMDPSNRAWVRNNWGRMNNPSYTATNGQPFYLIRNNLGSSVTIPGGLINSGPLKGTAFGPGGAIRQYNYGSIDDGNLMSGGEWQLSNTQRATIRDTDQSLDTRVSRQNLYLRASYDLTDDIEVFAQYIFSNTETYALCCKASRTRFTITADNPFIPATVLSRMQAAGVTSFQMSNYLNELPSTGTDNSRHFTQYLLGADGSFDAFATGWKWNFSLARSTNRVASRAFDNLVLPNFALAVDVVRSPTTGLPVCRSTLTNPGNGCIPYNPMGMNVNGPTANRYLVADGLVHQHIEQDFGAFSVTGEPLETWAGPVSVAFGAEHRNESTVGLASALDVANAFFVGNFKSSSGSYNVTDGFVETVIPLAKGKSWADSLDINAAVRETGYSTSGMVTTWKVGATYVPIQDFRFRATRSRDIRSPSLGELYSAGRSGLGSGLVDPFRGGTTALISTVTTGNPNLKPEKADTISAGVVFQPALVRGFNASVDYYNINMKNRVAALGGQGVVDACYRGDTVFCPFVQRDQSGVITLITAAPTNTAYAKLKGLDIESSYNQPLTDIVNSWGGSVTTRVLLTHLIDFTTVEPDGSLTQNAGVVGNGNPSWRYNVTVSYDADAFSVSWTGRGFNSGKYNGQYTGCTSGCPKIAPPYYTIDNNYQAGAFYMDLSVTYRFEIGNGMSASLFATAENLGNLEPIVEAPTAYDWNGRTFRAGLRFRM